MYSRHELVWLTTDGWVAACAQVHGGDRLAVDRWRSKDWPLVVCRREPGAPSGTLAAGIALAPDPSDGSKRRIALRLDTAHISRSTPPLPLSDALAAAPCAWRGHLEALAARIDCRVYGSLALQALTGMQYLAPGSDIDLLFKPAALGELDAGIAVLFEYAARLPLDGELEFPTGDAVAWKEWIGACTIGARVLVKSLESVRLAGTGELAASLEAGR